MNHAPPRFLLPFICLSLPLAGCRRDSGFTALKAAEPPVEDTSSPPVEVDDEALPVEAPVCPDPGIVPATLASEREDCRNDPVQTTFEPAFEWSMGSFTEFPAHTHAMNMPAVGHLTDDNGDGVPGEGDVPDIALSFYDGAWCGNGSSSAVLRVISGDGSTVHWSIREIPGHPEWVIAPYSAAVLGDIDADGEPEVVALAANGPWGGQSRVVAFRADGQLEWMGPAQPNTTTSFNSGMDFGVLSIFDIDQDGIPEVWQGSTLYSGLDGTPRAMGDVGSGIFPIVNDLDGDGFHELVTHEGIFDPSGTQVCNFGLGGIFTSLADLDGDGHGEVVLTGGQQIGIFDHTCALQQRIASDDGGSMGPATIADYDGDGQPEIGVASYDYYFVYEADGTELWKMPVSDRTSNHTGSSVYDFEGDGFAEVVYAGEYNLWVFSGVDGTVRLQDSSHDSCTNLEYPLVADVDGDGQVEIAAADYSGLRVIGDRREGWVPARQVWNQHAYSITNVGDDLSIPSYIEPNWPEYNSFRSSDQRLNNGDGANLVDAFAMEVDRCEIECDSGVVQLTIRAANQGLADANDGISLALYAEQADGSRALLETIPADASVRSSYTTEGYTLRLEMSDLPTGTLILVADDDGTGTGVIEECDEENNDVRLEDLCAHD